MIPIYNRGADKEKYNTLTNTLIEQIYNNMKTGKKSEFDISHPEFDVFYKADSYNIKYNDMKLYTRNIENIDSLDFLCEMQSREVAPMKTIDEFKKTFAKIQIYSYSFEDRELTYGTLLKHINGELKYDDKTYFIIDGQWLELKDEFKERLNRECKDYLSKYYNNALITAKWPNSSKKNEDAFIDILRNQNGHFKIHPVKTSENIELCDSIFIEDNITYLFFVKDGFDHSIRDLTSQAYISYRRLVELRKSGEKSLIYEYYDNIHKKYGDQNLDKEAFVNALYNNKLVAVLAFRPKSHAGISVQNNPELFDSNIAKYSLVSFVKEFTAKLDYNLNLIEIKTDIEQEK